MKNLRIFLRLSISFVLLFSVLCVFAQNRRSNSYRQQNGYRQGNTYNQRRGATTGESILSRLQKQSQKAQEDATRQSTEKRNKNKTKNSTNNQQQEMETVVTSSNNVATADHPQSQTHEKEKDDVVLVVSGEGQNKEEATKNALRSAIEQAFGTFVSANTEILNDELIKDEIATVASGNIKTYKEIATTILPNGLCSVTLSATVSTGKLVSYVQAHGGSAEFAGATFAMNIKMEELNKTNEAAAMRHLYEKLKALQPNLYDCSIEVGHPAKSSLTKYVYSSEQPLLASGYSIPLCVKISPTETLLSWLQEVQSTMETISLSPQELEFLKTSNIKTHRCRLLNKDYALRNYYGGASNINGDPSLIECRNLLNEWIEHLIVNINSGEYTFSFFTKDSKKKTASNLYFTTLRGTHEASRYLIARTGRRPYDFDCSIYTSTKGSAWTTKVGSKWIRNFDYDIPIKFWSKFRNGLSLDDRFVRDYIENHYPGDYRDDNRWIMEHSPSASDKWDFYLSFDLFFTDEELPNLKTFDVQWNYQSKMDKYLSILNEFLIDEKEKESSRIGTAFFSQRGTGDWSDWERTNSTIHFDTQKSSIEFSLLEGGTFTMEEYEDWTLDDEGWQQVLLDGKDGKGNGFSIKLRKKGIDRQIYLLPDSDKFYKFCFQIKKPIVSTTGNSDSSSSSKAEATIPSLQPAHTYSSEEVQRIKDNAVAYRLAAQAPSFNGGDINKLLSWVHKQIPYAIAKEYRGTHYLQLWISEEGYVADVKFTQNPIADETVAESIRKLFMAYKPIEPAKNDNGTNIPVVYDSVPLVFNVL